MIHLLEAAAGLITLGAPIVGVGIFVALAERNGRTRLVIVGGRVRRRASLGRKTRV